MSITDQLPDFLSKSSTAVIFNAAQRQVRKRLMSGVPLAEVMDTLLLTLEKAYPAIFSSVLLLKDDKLQHLSAPGLPDTYLKAIDGTQIGPSAGSCGTAAFTRERVIVESIATDLKWANYQQALDHGFKACWSQPILSAQDEKVLGTFAIYYKTERAPSEEEVQLLEMAADLAGTAIEWGMVLKDCHHLEEELKESNAALQALNTELENRIQARAEELEKQNYLTKTITDNATGALFMMDATGYCTFMNPAAVEMVGYTFDEIRAQQLHYMIHHHRPDGSHYPLEECPLDRALPQNFDVRAHEDVFFRKDGTSFPVSCAASPIFDENGIPISTVIEVRDITEEKRNRQELLGTVSQMQTLLSAMPQIAFTATVEGELDYVNGHWQTYTGLPQTDVLGEQWIGALHPEDKERAAATWGNSIQTGQDYEIEFRVRHWGGNYRWYLARAIPLKNEKGEVLKWFGTATDIHEQKLLIERLATAQEELQKMNAELTQKNTDLERTNADLDNFVYTASHDLKSPIANLQGLVKALQEELHDLGAQTEPVEPLLVMIEKAIIRFKNTIDELTEISKIQKQVETGQEVVYLEELVEEFKVINAELIFTSKATINTQVTAAPAIRFSKKNLRSVLYNLISNSIKYHHPDRKPVVKISTATLGDGGIMLRIEDNGLGIEEHHLSQIFGMFKRVHQHVEGSGVGLYIVKRIVENAGGEISVQSKVGEGTSFEIKLPSVAPGEIPG
ncbi:PAS domain S-box protein [Rufibacter hautae]|uniref:histidine kinase n=1 Tax=Rufibacter hautae TaxID=2595005 RepID=A0A5B6T9W8_9BACT|nr:PAS domain S-box protein [Rufibacter hautae]KAA3436667.1 PAS domain S-box protein [Rufibacter hautae]